MIRRASAWLAIPLVALALSACSSEGPGEAPESEDKASTVDVTDQQGSVEGFVGAMDDATVATCKSTNGGWEASGEVTNPTTEPQAYRIYVAFLQNNDTKGLVQVDLPTVEAGATESWEASSEITGDDLQCFLRVERFAP